MTDRIIGYTATAVQNTLTSLPDDIATTKRAIDAQEGSVTFCHLNRLPLGAATPTRGN